MHRIYIRFMINTVQAISLIKLAMAHGIGLVESTHFVSQEAILSLQLAQQQLQCLYNAVKRWYCAPNYLHRQVGLLGDTSLFLRNQSNLFEIHILS